MLLLATAVTGCKSVSVGTSHSATPIASPRATVVSPALAQYSQTAGAIVYRALTQANGLKTAMASGTLSAAGSACSHSGNLLANSLEAFKNSYAPAGAGQVYQNGLQGFRLALASVDECGMAADSGSTGELGTSLSDLNKGIKLLNSVQSTLQGWRPPKH